ncbi:hypothetical protein Hdeb2414_s0005g00159201 [Helianthus debilis subsp. tardiflorus]
MVLKNPCAFGKPRNGGKKGEENLCSFFATMWKLWQNRNERFFEKKKVHFKATLVDDIKVESFWWMVKRSKLAGLYMERWCRFEGIDFT